MVKLVTVLERHNCISCNGSGKSANAHTCSRCKGTGTVEVEVTR